MATEEIIVASHKTPLQTAEPPTFRGQVRVYPILSFVILIALTLLAVAYFYSLNKLFPICSDDYRYSFIFPNTERPITSLRDILESLTNHYVLWGGRMVAHGLAQFFLTLPKSVFEILNTVCYSLIIVLICALSKQVRLCAIAPLALVLWYTIPTPGTTIIWLTGSCNYLWSVCFVLLFLTCLLSTKRYLRFLAIPLALIAGNSHEGIALGLLAGLFLYCVLTYKTHTKSPLFYIAATVFVLGALTNLGAPGNFARFAATASTGASPSNTISFVSYVIHSIFSLDDFLCLIFIPLALLGCYLMHRDKNPNWQQAAMLLIAAITNLCFCFVAKSVYPRALFGAAFLALVATYITFAPYLCAKYLHSRRLYWISLFICLCFSHFVYMDARSAIKSFSAEETYIAEQAKSGNHLILLPPPVIPPHNRYIESWGRHANFIGNCAAANCYGVDSFSVIQDAEMCSILKHLILSSDLSSEPAFYDSNRYILFPLTEKPQRMDIECINPDGKLTNRAERYETPTFHYKGKWYVLWDTQKMKDKQAQQMRIYYAEGREEVLQPPLR